MATGTHWGSTMYNHLENGPLSPSLWKKAHGHVNSFTINQIRFSSGLLLMVFHVPLFSAEVLLSKHWGSPGFTPVHTDSTFPPLYSRSTNQNTVWWIPITSFLSEHKLNGSHHLPFLSGSSLTGSHSGMFHVCLHMLQSSWRRCSATCPASALNYAVLPSGLGKGCCSKTLWSGVNSGRTWSRSPFLLSSETEAMNLGWFLWVTRKNTKPERGDETPVKIQCSTATRSKLPGVGGQRWQTWTVIQVEDVFQGGLPGSRS